METSTYCSITCLFSVRPRRIRRNVNKVSKITLLEASWETTVSLHLYKSKTYLLRQSALNDLHARHLPALSHGFDVAHEILR